MTIDINPEFKQALDYIEANESHVFITGKAGTGKSTLLAHYCAKAKTMPVVLASTGVAALNVKGETIHSFFNFYVDVTPEKIRSLEVKPRKPKLYKNLETIIIDEISMVRADLLDCVDEFLRLYGPTPDEAFGGVQMVFVGDLYQLPPVVTQQERAHMGALYETPYFFSAHVFEDLAYDIVELKTIYRQKDQDFIDLLNRVRNNSVQAEDIQLLSSRVEPEFDPKDDFYIHLTTTNRLADDINDGHLDTLKGELIRSKAIIHGEVSKDLYPTAVELYFKMGAQVMLLNNDPQRRWVNGSLGQIEDLHEKDGETELCIRLEHSKKICRVPPFTWEMFHFDLKDGELISKPTGTFRQYPIRLAWAITIHKSQGKTFDKVVLDIGKGAFACGQVYVGLSRATSLEGLVLSRPIQKKDIRTDKRIQQFLTRYKYRQAEKQQSFDDKVTLIQDAIEYQTPLSMHYLKADDTHVERTIVPLSVANEHYQGKTFPGMKAKDLETQAVTMFHVGRILFLER